MPPPDCPICLSSPTEPFTTPCGHTFCYECISTHLQTRETCPLCPSFLTANQLQPSSLPPVPTTPPPNSNHTPDITGATSSRRNVPPPLPRHDKIPVQSPTATAQRRARAQARARATLVQAKQAFENPGEVPSSTPEMLLKAGEKMSAEQLAGMIRELNERLKKKEGSEKRVETELLLDFLRQTKVEKMRELQILNEEVKGLEGDLEIAEREIMRICPEVSAVTGSSEEKPRGKRRRLGKNVEVLQNRYFELVGRKVGEERRTALKTFTEDAYKLTRYARFKDRAGLMHVARVPEAGGDVFKASNIVSSIEFDRESEFVATAGVTRRIKIFEFANITRGLAEVHYPVREIPTKAKLSWVCWNPYIRYHLVSSDYEGFVTLWDVNRGSALCEFEEHENRAWSVDYCPTKPTLFASGSDDGRVKVWTTSQRSSVLTIDNKPANVCSVKFHPTQAEKLAFGSVDFNVHYYDLRNAREPLQIFKSHTRAVSYVKFMSPTQLVSASVDSTVKLWDLNAMSLERTFTGHVNDKNFVGLSVTPDYIVCGSEENTVYGYYKSIPKPFTAYRFSSVSPLTGEETQDDDESQFVSSVCWCPKEPNLLVAANSLGSLKVLELDTEGEADEASSR